MNRLSFVLAVACTVAAPLSALAAPQSEGFNHPQILAGLKQIGLFVGNVDPWLAAHNVPTSRLTAEVERKLGAAGITFAKEPAAPKDAKGDEPPPPVPLLYVKVKAHPEPDGGVSAYAIRLSLVESAVTKRNQKELMVSVWDANDAGRVTSDMSGEVVAALDRQLDQFVADYKAANPH